MSDEPDLLPYQRKFLAEAHARHSEAMDRIVLYGNSGRFTPQSCEPFVWDESIIDRPPTNRRRKRERCKARRRARKAVE